MSDPLVSEAASGPAPQPMDFTKWLIVSVAALGFAFDIYELLMMPLIARPALEELLGVSQYTDSGNADILRWTGYIMWGSAISGGIFGLLGGYLTDRYGRRRVLVWSILLYALSALAAGFSTSAEMLLVLRCTTFIGVCVEFVAAVAWLAELFPNPKQREVVLGYTQAFSSVGGLLVTGAYLLSVHFFKEDAWRYTLISGVIPALPLIIIRPFLPESPAWAKKKTEGTLKRPSFKELFQPQFRRTTLVTAALFACSYGAAFGAIQLTPQIVPGLVLSPGEQKEFVKLRKDLDKISNRESEPAKKIQEKIQDWQSMTQRAAGQVQLYQELGGLLGRFALAWLAIRIVSRRGLLRIFQVPGLILIPLVFFVPAAGALGDAETNIFWLKIGLFVTGFLTVAQFSFWGNYLPRVYPTHLRGTGESFSANVGGRMVGTAANPLSTNLAPLLPAILPGLALSRPASIAYAAAIVAFLVYAVGLVLSFWLPQPRDEELED